MSDSVVKLRIDSKEYDANIKRAGQALTDYFNKVKEGGDTLMHLDEGVMEAVKAMGSLGTQANNTKGGLRELTQATTDMTAAYRALTDEEKASPLGQAMQKSIAQMTERAGKMRDAMADVQASIQHAASDTRVFDQLSGGAQLLTASFQAATGAANLLGIEMGDNVEVIAMLQAAMGVVNGLQTIQTALQKQSAVMQGVQAEQAAAAAAAQTSLAGATGAATVAQKAFNLVANANPYVLLATTVAAVGTALYAFASASSKAKQEAEEMAKAEEEAAKKSEDARNAFVNASAESMNSASRLSSLRAAYKNANSEIEKTNILKQAQQEFKKLGIECKGVNDAQTLLIKNGSKVIELIQLQGNVAAVSAVRMEKFKELFKMLMEKGYSTGAAAILAGYNKEVQELDGQITTMQGKIQNLKGGLGVGGGNTNKPSKSTTSTTEPDPVVGSIAEMEHRLANLQKAWKNAADDDSRARIKEQIDLVKEAIEGLSATRPDPGSLKDYQEQLEATNTEITSMREELLRMKEAGEDPWEIQAKEDSLNNAIGKLNDIQNKIGYLNGKDVNLNVNLTAQGDTDMGAAMVAELENSFLTAAQNLDLSSFAQKFQDALTEDAGDMDLSEYFSNMKDSIAAYIDEEDWPKIQLAIETGDLNEIKKWQKQIQSAAKSTEDGWKQAASAVSQLGGALAQIEDPTAKVIGTIAQAVATIALSYSQAAASPAVTSSGWGWIAFAATGIATMISSIAAIKQATSGFSSGGIIPGNSMSGDNLRGMTPDGQIFGLDSQEVVLNRAQVGNLASQLEGGGMGNLQLETRVNAEDIIFILNNNGNRRNYGNFIND